MSIVAVIFLVTIHRGLQTPVAKPNMRFQMKMQWLLAFAAIAKTQVYNTFNSQTAVAGTADTLDPSIIGNYYNYWKLQDNGTTYDLTRQDRMPVTSPKKLPMMGSRQSALIEPNRTAMIIIDMQNYFLHPKLSPSATLGRAAVQPTLNMINAFRANGMKVLWVQWGIDNADLVTMPPSFLEGFSDDHTVATSFCSDMGTLVEDDGTKVQMGGKLCRGAWNARPWGALDGAMVEGLESGTDLYFHKSEFSLSFLGWVVIYGQADYE